MEHIWQSSQEHTPSSLDVAEDVPGLTPATYLRAILYLPISDRFEKLVPLSRGTNLGNPKEDFSEPPPVGSHGGATTPGQALPLYMDQTPLHHDVRPELPKNSYHVGLPSTVKLCGHSPSDIKRSKNARN